VDKPHPLLGSLFPETGKLLDMAAHIGVAIVVGFLVLQFLFLLVGRLVKWIESLGQGSEHAHQRGRTVGQILRNLCTVVVAGAVIIHSLAILGWDVRPLLAGAGLVSVALGFGAQTLVRDLIAGLFIIAEDQFGVGDLIDVNGHPATVEALTVRSTTLRDFNGFVYYVPNGEMKIVINRSRGWNRWALDVPIAAGQDVDQALAIVRREVQRLNDEPAWRSRLLDPVAVWGVETLSGNEVQIRSVVRALPGAAGPETLRELRLRVYRGLGEAGIRTSTTHEITLSSLPAIGEKTREAPPAEMAAPRSS
jgi:small conductance mechanosensitive channel